MKTQNTKVGALERQKGITARRPWLTYHRKQKISGFLFVAPVLIYFAIFSVYPILKAFQVSFYEWDLVSPMTYVGIENYRTILETNDSSKMHSRLLSSISFWPLHFPGCWVFR